MTPTSFAPIGVLHDREASTNEGYEMHIYLVTKWSGTPQNRADKEHSEVRWFAISDALRLKLAYRKYPETFERLDVKPTRTEPD